MKYEAGMHIVYDVLTKGAVVYFRGRVEDLPGPFGNQKEAISAGEALCRRLGWGSEPERDP